MPIELSPESRFKITNVTEIDGKETFGRIVYYDFLQPDLVRNENIINFRVTSEYVNRPDLIADRIYGNSELQWIVIMFNSKFNPFNWPALGEIVPLPSPSIVLPAL